MLPQLILEIFLFFDDISEFIFLLLYLLTCLLDLMLYRLLQFFFKFLRLSYLLFETGPSVLILFPLSLIGGRNLVPILPILGVNFMLQIHNLLGQSISGVAVGLDFRLQLVL